MRRLVKSKNRKKKGTESFKSNLNSLGQLWVLQSSVSCCCSEQLAPPCRGNGLSQKRCLFLFPPSQPLSQTVHEDQSPHAPSRGTRAGMKQFNKCKHYKWDCDKQNLSTKRSIVNQILFYFLPSFKAFLKTIDCGKFGRIQKHTLVIIIGNPWNMLNSAKQNKKWICHMSYKLLLKRQTDW